MVGTIVVRGIMTFLTRVTVCTFVNVDSDIEVTVTGLYSVTSLVIVSLLTTVTYLLFVDSIVLKIGTVTTEFSVLIAVNVLYLTRYDTDVEMTVLEVMYRFTLV